MYDTKDTNIRYVGYKEIPRIKLSESVDLIAKSYYKVKSSKYSRFEHNIETDRIHISLIDSEIDIDRLAGVTEDDEDIAIHMIDEFDYDANAKSCRTIRINKNTLDIQVECIKTAVHGKDSRILKNYMTSNEYNKFLNTL